MTETPRIRCGICAQVINTSADKYVLMDGMRNLNAHTVCWELFVEFLTRRMEKIERGEKMELNGFKLH